MPAARILSPSEAAAVLGCDLQMLRIWRARGDGPKWVHCGGIVKYLSTDLHAYLTNERRTARRNQKQFAARIDAMRRGQITDPSISQAVAVNRPI